MKKLPNKIYIAFLLVGVLFIATVSYITNNNSKQADKDLKVRNELFKGT